MYKLNKEYKGQDVTCFFPDGSFIKLEIATEEDFAKVYKVKGYQKFITTEEEIELEDIDLTLKELREKYPNISARSKEDFLKEIELKDSE